MAEFSSFFFFLQFFISVNTLFLADPGTVETVDKQLDAPCNFLIICHFVYQLSTE